MAGPATASDTRPVVVDALTTSAEAELAATEVAEGSKTKTPPAPIVKDVPSGIAPVLTAINVPALTAVPPL